MLRGLNRYPDPTNARAARRAVATATACPPSGSRSATARATSCSPPARRCSSPAPSSSTRGRRSRVYPHLAAASGAHRDPRPARRRATSTTSRRCSREITVATRLVIVCNPNNPTSTAVPAASDRGLRRAGPAPRLRDRRRGLLRVQHARRPRRDARRCSPRTRTSSCCAPSRKVYGLAGLRVGFALCGSDGARRAPSNQVRQPFFCNAPAQAAAIEALRHQDEVDRARRARGRRARSSSTDGLRALGHRASPTRRRTSAGSTLPAEPARTRRALERRVVAACASAACSCAPAPRSAARAALRVTYGTPGGERALPRGDRRAIAAVRSSV